ncbi:LOW QUALITY PROTEIN: protein-L-histidine N-pros-methyltransferase-like [Rhipicephalus sanguineus]|nr:LOW QUALITY PROTEIN: protein-L-histidine N-pros-methyltransferase-like [Rhipicephalus sanguineus]
MATLRPMLHSPLARTLYERLLRDQDLERLDKRQWYSIDTDQLTDEFLLQSFVQCELDADTRAFLDRSTEKSNWLGTQILHAVARLFLGWFLTKTTLNGFLGRGSMFVFSMSQFLRLLRLGADSPKLPLFGSLLDVGAGDGNVTAAIAPLFGQVDVTEKSPSMRRVLSRRGFRVLDAATLRPADGDDDGEEQLYDVVCCLNVLDRCETPLGLLRTLRARLSNPSGRLVLALVLPLSQYVESGKCGAKPLETLYVRGSTLEQQVQSLYKDVLVPAGFILESWTRLPYLCEGDLEQAYYWLDDVVMVLRAADTHGDGPS